MTGTHLNKQATGTHLDQGEGQVHTSTWEQQLHTNTKRVTDTHLNKESHVCTRNTPRPREQQLCLSTMAQRLQTSTMEQQQHSSTKRVTGTHLNPEVQSPVAPCCDHEASCKLSHHALGAICHQQVSKDMVHEQGPRHVCPVTLSVLQVGSINLRAGQGTARQNRAGQRRAGQGQGRASCCEQGTTWCAHEAALPKQTVPLRRPGTPRAVLGCEVCLVLSKRALEQRMPLLLILRGNIPHLGTLVFEDKTQRQ